MSFSITENAWLILKATILEQFIISKKIMSILFRLCKYNVKKIEQTCNIKPIHVKIYIIIKIKPIDTSYYSRSRFLQTNK